MALRTQISTSLQVFSSSKLVNRHEWISSVNGIRCAPGKYSSRVPTYNHITKRAQTAHAMSAANTLPFPIPETEAKEKASPNFTIDAGESGGNISLWGRNWHWLDLRTALMVAVPHVLALFAPFTFTWSALYVAMGLIVVTGYGLALSYHRNLTHRSFKLPKWLEYFFAYCGVLAIQKDPIYWVSTHRYHHMYSDTERDPQSPIHGLWFSHMGWFFDSEKFAARVGESEIGKYSNVKDLEKQPYYMFLNRTYYAHVLASAVLLYVLGGFPFLVWGLGVRTVFVYHSTFLAASGYHSFGKKVWNTNDLSKNNGIFALVSFGESWHNNHHAFPYSARVGLEWWQFDSTWYLIRLLEYVGLATDVKLPTEKDKQRLSLSSLLGEPVGARLPDH